MKKLHEILDPNEFEQYGDTIFEYASYWGSESKRSFYNYCKITLISKDDKISNEIYSRSSLCRYISGMFYALSLASLVILISIVIMFYMNDANYKIMLFIFSMYLLAIIAIIRNLRFMRLSEVQTVFYGTYQNRDIFENTPKESN